MGNTKVFTCKLFLLIQLIFPTLSVASPDPLPTITDAKAGATSGTFEVAPIGASTYNIAIVIPPGTAGVEPSLSISYESTGGNGLLGVGWGLSGLSAITRCAANRVTDGFIQGVQLNSSDRFCLDGQRLVAVSGDYGSAGSEYRTQNDGLLKVIFQDENRGWRVYRKDGTVSEYGNTADSRVEAQNRSTPLLWNISRTTDRKGNYLEYSYFEDQARGESYPLSVRYTGNAGVAPYNSIRFVYEARSDSAYGYVAGSKTTQSKRLASIRVFTGEQQVKRYDLRYDNTSPSRRSRLMQVQECDATGECLAPTAFSWSGGRSGFGSQSVVMQPGTFGQVYAPTNGEHETIDVNGDGRTDRIWRPHSWWRWPGGLPDGYRAISFPTDSGYSLPSAFAVGNSLEAPYYSYSDVDGDGDLDRIELFREQQQILVSLFQNSVFAAPTLWQYGPGISNNEYEGVTESERWLDVNGDSRVDHLFVNNQRMMVSYSTGLLFTPPTQAIFPTDGCLGFSQGMTTQTFADFNGDGLPDYLYRSKNCDQRIYVALNTGDSFATPTVWINFDSIGFHLHPDFYTVGDVNGDGLEDFIWRRWGAGDLWVSISTGTGFLPPVQWVAEWEIDGRSVWAGQRTHTFLSDLNSDGKADLITRPDGQYAWYVLYSNGADFDQFQQILPGTVSYNGQSFNFPTEHIDWIDQNGDGLLDVSYVIDEASVPQLIMRLGVGEPSDLLTNITNGLGAEVRIEYRSLADNRVYQKGSGALYPAVDLQGAIQVVSAVERSDGNSGFGRMSYRYSGLRADVDGRGLSGFRSVSVTDETSGVTTTTSYLQSHPYKMLIEQQLSQASNGTVIRRNENQWQARSMNQGRSFSVDLMQAVSTEFELDGRQIRQSTSTMTYDTWGNLLSKIETRSDGSSETTESIYENDSQRWILGQLRESRVSKRSGQIEPITTRTSRMSYDYTTGLLAEEEIEPESPSLKVTKSYQYDRFGNMIQMTTSSADEEDRVISQQFDGRGQFPVQSTDALGFVTILEHEPVCGKLVKRIDPNELVTSWEYDNFCRTKREVRPDGTETRTLFLKASPTQALPNEAYYVRTDASGAAPQIVRYDQLGREIQTEGVGFDGRHILVDKVYDPRGQLSHVSEPYFVGEMPRWNVSEYDILGRVVHITAPGDVHTVMTYDGLRTVTTNALGQQSVRTLDNLGRLISAEDAAGGVVAYKYDGFGNMVEARDLAGNITTIEYDVQGRKTRIVDPDAGTSDFTYNGFGQPKTQTTANGQLITFAYDSNGRMIQRTTPEGTEKWVYDLSRNGLGKLSEVVGLKGYRQSYEYDDLGRISQTITTIDGVRYVTRQVYDRYGRVDSFVYPSSFTLKSIFNQFGYLAEQRRLDTGATIWRAEQRNARGQLMAQRLGNTLLTTRNYDSNTGYLTAINTGTAQQLGYQFDKIGNLVQRSDNRLQLTERFAYDSLNRLVESSVGGQQAVSASYDALGNIIERSDVGLYRYGENRAGPHAVTSISGVQANWYRYDAAGQRVASASGDIVYTATGKAKSIREGTTRIEFELNPADERVLERRYSGSLLQESKSYVGGVFERITTPSSTAEVHYVQGADGLVAIYTKTTSNRRSFENSSDSLSYILTDHLGSVQTVVSEAGKILELLSYDAWGRRRDPITWSLAANTILSRVSRGFTGHEHLDAVKLIHMNGRIFDPINGRFLSPDPVVQAIGDTQNLNRYSYVLNNPLSNTDPTGYFLKKLFKSFRAMIQNPKSFAILIASMATGFWAAAQVTAFATCNVVGAAIFTNVTATSITSVATGGFASATVGSLLHGNSIGDSLKNGLIGAATAGTTKGFNLLVDEIFPHYLQSSVARTSEGNSIASQVFSSGELARQVPRFLLRGSAQGAVSYALGGKFATGFQYSFGADVIDLSYSMLNEYAWRWEKQNIKLFPWQRMANPAGLHTTLETPEFRQGNNDYRSVSLHENAPWTGTTGSANEAAGVWRGEKGLVGWIGNNIPTVNGLSLLHDQMMGPSIFNIPTNSNAAWWQDAFNIGTIPPVWFYNAAGGGLNGLQYEQQLIRK